MNVMVKVAQFIGVPLRVISIGGHSLKSLFDIIDDQLFANVVAKFKHSCVHLSTCYRSLDESQH